MVIKSIIAATVVALSSCGALAPAYAAKPDPCLTLVQDSVAIAGSFLAVTKEAKAQGTPEVAKDVIEALSRTFNYSAKGSAALNAAWYILKSLPEQNVGESAQKIYNHCLKGKDA